LEVPSEERSIIFDFDEVSTALNAFSAQIHEKYFPAGEITSISVKKAEKGVFVFQVVGRKSQKTEKVELSEGLIAASLLMHCMGTGIPICKAVTKTVEVGGVLPRSSGHFKEAR
jgi:hypothetical protein